MREKQSGMSHAISGVFVFVLIGVFALTALALTLVGTRVYQRVTSTSVANGDTQLVLSYLCNKVHNYDHTDGVRLESRDGLDMLCLREELEGETFETTIYAYNGAIWERFGEAGKSFDPEEGQRLVEAKSLVFEQVNARLIRAEVTLSSGETRSLHMALRAFAPNAG